MDWCVYEDAAGVAWQVTPPTEEHALAEAALCGIGHRAVPVAVAKALANAFAHGKQYRNAELREQRETQFTLMRRLRPAP